jgi:putative hemolysin
MTLFLIVLMLALSAFFSGSEIAFITANRLKAEVRAHREGLAGRLVREFIRDPGMFLTTTLVGNNVALVLYSLMMALYLEPPLAGAFTGWFGPEAPIEALVLIVQTVVASLVVLIFGEILPKSLAREPADWVVFTVALPLKVTYWIFLPMVKLAGWMSQGIARAFGIRGDSLKQFLRRDYEAVVRESRETGSLDLDEEESTILSNVFEFQATRVREVMVSRPWVEAISEDATMEEAYARFIETGYSRLLIYRENVDQIVGMVKALDLFEQPASLAEIVREVPFVPEAKRAKDLLYEMLAEGTPMAVVVDEYGGTAGVVTVEDLLEELFGEIRDEYDEPEGIDRVSEGVYVVEGRTEIHVLNEEYSLTLPEGEGYETVAGLIIHKLSTIPKVPQELEVDGYRLTVVQATASRIERVRISRIDDPRPPDEEDEE